jgi:hypothetical protein
MGKLKSFICRKISFLTSPFQGMKQFICICDILYFNHNGTNAKFSEADIINMLEFLIDNIFAMFDGRVFQQAVGIPMGKHRWTNSFNLSFIALSGG